MILKEIKMSIKPIINKPVIETTSISFGSASGRTSYVILNDKEAEEYTAYRFLFWNKSKTPNDNIMESTSKDYPIIQKYELTIPRYNITFQRIHELVKGSTLGKPNWTGKEEEAALDYIVKKHPELADLEYVAFKNPDNVRFVDLDTISNSIETS